MKGEEKKIPTRPWQPASMLTVPSKLLEKLKREGKRAKWIRTKELDRREAEGWEPVKYNAEPGEVTIIDGKQVGANFTKREMTLCSIPEEMAESRKEYFQSQTEGLLQGSVDRYERDASVSGTKKETYGKIEVEAKEEK